VERPASAPPPSNLPTRERFPIPAKPPPTNLSEERKLSSPAVPGTNFRPSSTVPVIPSPLSNAPKRMFPLVNSESSRPPKRARNEGSSHSPGPSLLDRMKAEPPKRPSALLPPLAQPLPYIRPARSSPHPRNDDAPSPAPSPVLSIKGAARRASTAEVVTPRDAPQRPSPEHRPESASLLERMGTNDGAPRKKRRNP
jgi:hypothetical protein